MDTVVIGQLTIAAIIFTGVWFLRGISLYLFAMYFYIDCRWHSVVFMVVLVFIVIAILEIIRLASKRAVFNFGSVVGNPLS